MKKFRVSDALISEAGKLFKNMAKRHFKMRLFAHKSWRNYLAFVLLLIDSLEIRWTEKITGGFPHLSNHLLRYLV